MKPKSKSSPRKVITPTGKAEVLPILAIALLIFLLPVRDFLLYYFILFNTRGVCRVKPRVAVAGGCARLAPPAGKVRGGGAVLLLFSWASVGVKMEVGGDNKSCCAIRVISHTKA